jgi:hypothetical protein
MQDCFRQYPEVYADELAADDDDHEDDAETLSPGINSSPNSNPPNHNYAIPSPEVDEPSVYTPPAPKPAPLHPQVDEPSIYPQTPPNPSPLSSGASQQVSPDGGPVSESEQLAPKALYDVSVNTKGQ